MRIFQATSGADTAGISVAIKRAFARHAPDWPMDSMISGGNYIAYPVDVPWSQRDLQRLYDGADVVHIHNTLHIHNWYDGGQRKPSVLHHHGMHSLAQFRQIAADARAAKISQVGSTLDLCLLEPDLEWLPAPANLPELRGIRSNLYRPSKVVRIGHAPTNRSIKGSDAFERAIVQLKAEGLPVEGVVIERTTWADCLARKANVDILFDQPVLGYGSNAIEAWAMGIPVVSGVADPVIRKGMIARWDRLPFYEANEATLVDGLRAMLDPALREEYAAIGTAHVERWHDERVTVDLLKRMYAYAASAPSVAGGSAKRVRQAPAPVVYEPVAYWQDAGRNPGARDSEANFVHTDAFARQEEQLMALLEVRDFASILEVGCGWGRITKLVHDRWPDKPYHAIDLSGEAIASARRKVTGVTFDETTIQDFEADRTWDLVLAVEALMHVKPDEIEAVIAKLLALSTRCVVSLDWSASLGNAPIAPWNFRHDYEAMYGERLVKTEPIGLQSIYVAKVSNRPAARKVRELVPA
jgi:hypothetical protein